MRRRYPSQIVIGINSLFYCFLHGLVRIGMELHWLVVVVALYHASKDRSLVALTHNTRVSL